MYLHDGPAYGHYQIMLDFVPFKDLTKLAVVNICLFIFCKRCVPSLPCPHDGPVCKPYQISRYIIVYLRKISCLDPFWWILSFTVFKYLNNRFYWVLIQGIQYRRMGPWFELLQNATSSYLCISKTIIHRTKM